MERRERVLTWLLRLEGAFTMTALCAVVMPHAWMDLVHRSFGMGELPQGPIIEYLTRSLSAFYAMYGALLIFIATDVRRFLTVLRFLAAASLVFGLMMLVIDIAAGMPLFWIALEGPFVAGFSAVVLGLAKNLSRSPGICSNRR